MLTVSCTFVLSRRFGAEFGCLDGRMELARNGNASTFEIVGVCRFSARTAQCLGLCPLP